MLLGYGGKSALACHCLDLGHQILLSAATVLFEFSGEGGGRLVRESVEILMEERALNWEDGLRLSSAWLPTLNGQP